MKLYRYILLLFITIFFFLSLLAVQEKDRWGIGIIMPENKSIDQMNNKLFFPNHITIYDANNQKIGSIDESEDKIVVSVDSKIYKFDNLSSPPNNWTEIGFEMGDANLVTDFIEIGNEGAVLKYYSTNKNMVKVLFSFSKHDCFLDKDELKQKGYIALNWNDFFQKLKGISFESRGNLNLRKMPYVSGEKIFTIKPSTINGSLRDGNEYYYINILNEKRGNWAKVKVRVYDSTTCEPNGSDGFIKEKEGWIKLFDDAGFPNVWYSTRGC